MSVGVIHSDILQICSFIINNIFVVLIFAFLSKFSDVYEYNTPVRHTLFSLHSKKWNVL